MNRSPNYNTHQRQDILSLIKEDNSCLTAEDIIIKLSSQGKNVSKATVYRSLEKFVNEGEILKFIPPEDNSSGYLYRYNGNHKNHYHLQCTNCQKTICIDCDFIEQFESHFFKHHGFIVNQTQTIFYGLCKDCSSI